MTSAVDILRTAKEAGLSVTARADRLAVRPADRLTAEMHTLLLTNKPVILAHLHSREAERVLAEFAVRHGIYWPDARSQMIDGDAVAGAANLAADTGDGVEVACVACWLRLLAARA